jgi:hypothetical protein
MTETKQTKTETTTTEEVHQATVADVPTSVVDAAFDAGTKAVIDVLSFAREALQKSATALEHSAKKVEELSTALKD